MAGRSRSLCAGSRRTSAAARSRPRDIGDVEALRSSSSRRCHCVCQTKVAGTRWEVVGAQAGDEGAQQRRGIEVAEDVRSLFAIPDIEARRWCRRVEGAAADARRKGPECNRGRGDSSR